ncbi:alkaline phosphatase family protein [Brevundimonas diminuta]|jgi:predicted AlkP superfamily pyrophosphatase or phosphodiesterase|uniref:alkaline phosphatase family protein n=1 Tax=Brevundimonas TaxID=41275 RepID=UPI0019051CB0|nr:MULTISPECIES: alkaline phosphatase family protein [Brevundimonas]MBK1968456.1 alkaline phosphatase family protein [Brevundimonas diminuta]MDA0744248.1 alkaline phosphatase family protein [Pseudomonadota bacterium]MDA1321401.1 alkaline phosphatase family protein [Pseudomonadota bacterium]
MIRSRLLASALGLTLGLVALSGAAQAAETTAPAAAPAAERASPSLIVTVVVDQLSANLFNQYRRQFTGGLKTLADQGMVSINGYQTHGVTVTCAGHSTVLTGAHPARSGIPANDWIDTTTGQETYCLAAPQNTLAHGKNTDNGPVGPEQLSASTLGDWLKAVSPESRVYGVSGKDRGAINLAGHKGDGAFWLTDNFGFTTYVEPGQSAEARLAPVAALNARMIDRFTRQAPSWTYSNAACRRLEGQWTIAGQTFDSKVPPANFRLDNSPILDELTIEGAIELMDSQQLGRRGVTDMLGVSLSATDRIGHSYGTQGPEMCEQMLRLDAALGAFLDKLSTVPGGAIVVLTADHGGSDFPERSAVEGYPHAGRVDRALQPRVNAALKARFGLDADPVVSSAGGFVIVDKDRKSLPEPLRSQVLAAAIELLNAEPQVALAVARDELLAEPVPNSINPEDLSVRERLRLSAVAGRSPDILRAWQPGLTGQGRVGGAISSHGSPWDYDRRVPIVFWWPGAEGQERFLPMRTIDIAPTLANLIGVTPDAPIDGRCMDLPQFAKGRCETK